MLRIEGFVRPHQRHQIFRFRKVDDVVRVAGQHMHRFNFVTGHFKVHHRIGLAVFIRSDATFLDESVPRHHDEEFPLRVVPVLSFCNSRFRDVDGKLPAVDGLHKFRKTPTGVDVHLQRKLHGRLRQVREVRGIEFLRKGTRRNLRHQKGLRFCFEGVKPIHDFAQRGFVRDGSKTVMSCRIRYRFHSFKFTTVLVSLQGIQHLVDKIIDVE